MNKKIILLTIVMVVVALTMGACIKFKPPEDNTTTPGSGGTDNNPSVKPKTTKEVVDEYLASIEDNFSAKGEIKNNLGELLKGGQKYSTYVDGNASYVNNDGEKYYLEKDSDDNEYVYLQQGSTWHKKQVTEKDNYKSGISKFTDILKSVEWKRYNAATNYAEGQFKYKGNDMWLECTMRSDGATVKIYQIRHSWLLGDTLLSIGNIEIYDVGSTTVTLPTNVTDDTVATSNSI